MWTKTTLTITALVVLLVGCGSPDAASEGDAATVHGAYLAHRGSQLFLVERTSRVSQFLSTDPVPPDLPTTPGDTWREVTRGQVQSAMEDLRPETWDAFLKANETTRVLSQVIRFSGQVVYLSEGELDQLVRGDLDQGYRRLFSRYPGSEELTAMSMPGVSRDGSQALLYVETRSGAHAGSGIYYLLVREDGAWRIVDEFRSWIR